LERPPYEGMYSTMIRERQEDVIEVIRHHWNARAATFDRELGHGVHSEAQRQAWLALLTRLAGAPAKRVLDVGCGTGFLALLFAELGHTVTGVDLAGEMLEVARRKAASKGINIQYRSENAASLTDADGTYDFVIARHVLWTLPDPPAAVTEWLRVLRPGGRLVVIEGKWAANESQPKYPRSVRTAIGGIAHTTLWLLYRAIGRNYDKFYARKYKRIETELPFFGGPPADRLAALLIDRGARDVVLEPLMDPVLWGGERPQFARYLVSGSR
jgi:2-polyprenyl-3-methyl-5-hydroxy-6-metoxy-1,4-benzoquinol methylase